MIKIFMEIYRDSVVGVVEVNDKFICKICGKECKGLGGLSGHVSRFHKIQIKLGVQALLKYYKTDPLLSALWLQNQF